MVFTTLGASLPEDGAEQGSETSRILNFLMDKVKKKG
jgi:hypothetical protein